MTTPVPPTKTVTLPADTPDDVLTTLNANDAGIEYVKAEPEPVDTVEPVETVSTGVVTPTAETVDSPVAVTEVPAVEVPETAAAAVEVPNSAPPLVADVTAPVTTEVGKVSTDATAGVVKADTFADSGFDSAAAVTDKESASLIREIHALASTTDANIAKVAAFIDDFGSKIGDSPLGKMLGIVK